MANSNYSDALATTLAYRSKELADNVSKNNALLHHLKDKSKIREISGGSKILEELEYGEGDMIWYNGYDAIDYSPKQLFSAAEYALKLCAVPVAISGEDLLKNSGPEKIIDLFEKRVENAFKTMSNQMSKAIYSDGTGSSGKEIGGLKFLVADAPETGTVGGINRATSGNEFWRNKSTTASAAGLPIPKEFKADARTVGYGLADHIWSQKFVICHSALQSLQIRFFYRHPLWTGRLMTRMTQRAAQER